MRSLLVVCVFSVADALTRGGGHAHGHRQHGVESDVRDNDEPVLSDQAKKLENQARLRGLRWPAESLVGCLAGNAAAGSKATRLQQCLDSNQRRCSPGNVQPVCAWAAGFGSGVHMWVHSFTFALEQGIAWAPVGPWSYADPRRCPDQAGAPAGQSCYFKDVHNCTLANSSLPLVCAQWYNRHNSTTLVINAAKQLNVSREWIWGQLADYMLQMLPDVRQSVQARIPRELQEGPSAAIQIRVVSAATGQDGMRVNLGVAAYLQHLKDKASKLQNPPKKVYVMSDDPSLSQEKLNKEYPEYQFLRPQREWADVARGSTNQSQSKSEVTYDLLADIFAAVESEVFIGTASNLFWLVYALKQTKPSGPGISCWINTVEQSPDFKKLFCPGDPGFYTYSPPGIRPSMEEEYVALLRDGLDRKSAWAQAYKVHNLRTRVGAVI